MASRISSSETNTARSITRRQTSSVTEPGSRPPAVLSDSVGRSGTSTTRPARMHSYMTGEFSGQQPTTSTAGFVSFRYPPMPPISPPPPTATKTASRSGHLAAASRPPMVPCPAITSASLYGEMKTRPDSSAARLRGELGSQRVVAGAMQLRAESLDAARFCGRDVRRNEHLRRDPARLRRRRDAEAVVAVRRSHHPRRRLLRREQRDLVARAAELERPRLLQMLQLQPCPEVGGVLQRRLPDKRPDPLVGGEDLVAHLPIVALHSSHAPRPPALRHRSFRANLRSEALLRARNGA